MSPVLALSGLFSLLLIPIGLLILIWFGSIGLKIASTGLVLLVCCALIHKVNQS